jgi:hypothetical protein
MDNMARISEIWKAKIEAWQEQETELAKFERPRNEGVPRGGNLLDQIKTEIVTYTICIEGTKLKLEQLVGGTNVPTIKTDPSASSHQDIQN